MDMLWVLRNSIFAQQTLSKPEGLLDYFGLRGNSTIIRVPRPNSLSARILPP
jgi:hypothetical protein